MHYYSYFELPLRYKKVVFTMEEMVSSLTNRLQQADDALLIRYKYI